MKKLIFARETFGKGVIHKYNYMSNKVFSTESCEICKQKEFPVRYFILNCRGVYICEYCRKMIFELSTKLYQEGEVFHDKD